MIGKNPIIKLNMEVPVKTANPALPETEQETGSRQWRGGNNQKMNGKKIELCIDVKIMQARRR